MLIEIPRRIKFVLIKVLKVRIEGQEEVTNYVCHRNRNNIYLERKKSVKMGGRMLKGSKE